MNALSMLRDWRRQVQEDLLPGMHGHRSKVLADLSFAMTLVQHCRAGKLADDGPRLFRRYAKRTWTEELFRDEKSSGFRRGDSHVDDPVHAARLTLLLALATYLAPAVGSRVIEAGLRRSLESTRRRMLSDFTIGLRWVMYCLTHDRSLPENLSPVPQ